MEVASEPSAPGKGAAHCQHPQDFPKRQISKQISSLRSLRDGLVQTKGLSHPGSPLQLQPGVPREEGKHKRSFFFLPSPIFSPDLPLICFLVTPPGCNKPLSRSAGGHPPFISKHRRAGSAALPTATAKMTAEATSFFAG